MQLGMCTVTISFNRPINETDFSDFIDSSSTLKSRKRCMQILVIHLFLDKEGGSQKATVVVVGVVISSLG